MATKSRGAGDKSEGHGGGERSIKRVHEPVPAVEGGGVIIERALPSHEVPYEEVDPFLLLDVFDEAKAGPLHGEAFPKHPHRGFEILTYLLSGASNHTGSVGDGTVLRGGGIQKITTGRGIWHGEGMGQKGGEPVRGLQLWVNLARRDKLIDPDYQVLKPEEVPVEEGSGAHVKVLVGPGSPIRMRTPTLYLDVTVPPGKPFAWDVPGEFQGFAYVLQGEGKFGADGTPGDQGKLLILGPGERFRATANGNGVRFMLAAAKPLREPVRWNGPYVD